MSKKQLLFSTDTYFFPEGMGGGVVSNWGLNVGPLSHILGKCSTNKLKSTTHFKDFQLPVS